MSGGGGVIYRKVRQESKNICSLVQVNFVYNGHFILNSFSLTTQQNRIYRLPDTIRTRASDVTWEVGRINLLNCLFISPESLGSLCLVWEWSIYVVVMNVIFIRWGGEGGGRGVMIVGSRHSVWTEYLSWYHQTGDTRVLSCPPWLSSSAGMSPGWGARSEAGLGLQAGGRRFCWPIRWSDGQTDAQ